MSEFETEYDEKPGPSVYSSDDGTRGDVHFRGADPANSHEEIQAQAEDDGWRESDLNLEEPEDDGWRESDFHPEEPEDDGWRESDFHPEEPEDDGWRESDFHPEEPEDDGYRNERSYRHRRSRRKNRPRPTHAEGWPESGKKRRTKIRLLSDNSSGGESDETPECPSPQATEARGLEDWEHRPQGIGQEFYAIKVNPRTQASMEELLSRASDAVTDGSDCNFLTRAWEFEENNKACEKCIQDYKDPDLDAKYYEELIKKKEDPKYSELCAFREKLPAHGAKEKIVEMIKGHQVCFISGGTGCGKTTQIVQFVLDDCIMNMNGSGCNIICTQPRRVSASSIAQRIAAERLEPLSLTVGYQIRFENKLAERKVGCINFVTTGVLLQWLVTNWLLPHVSHIFLDEVHDKTIEFDAVMALLKTIIQERRDLKIILMSATIDSDSFCQYFDGAPSLEIPGYTFPVQDFYLDDILRMTDYKVPEQKVKVVPNYDPDPEFEDFEEDVPCVQNLVHGSSFRVSEDLDIPLIAHLIGYICANEEDGAILVFLPGLSDIIRLKKKITGSPWYIPERHLIVVAHSLLPAEGQMDVFVIPPEGKRKIILSTSIMETSITLDDMSYVVDCGKIKFSSFDVTLKVSSLDATWITKANANQRKGRVGRTKPGKCYKLYTKHQEDNFVSYPPTDMQLTTLERIILDLKLLKIPEVVPFLEKMMDPPHPVMVELALKELRKMNALGDNEQLTPLGYHLSKLPLDVRTGKMILMGACFSCIDPIFSIAACLSFKDPFNVLLDEDKVVSVKDSYSSWERSDHVVFSEIVRDWENENFSNKRQFCSEKYLSESNLNQISEAKKEFAKVLHLMNFLPSADVKDPASNVNSKNPDFIKAIVCAGLYPSVATSTGRTRNMGVRTLEGQFAQFHGKSLLSEYPSCYLPFFAYFYILRTSTKTFIHDASMVDIIPLLLFGKGLEITKRDNYTFVEVDDKLIFKVGPLAARLLKDVRNLLDQVLGRALLKSESFNWSQGGKEIEILRGIVDLIQTNEITHKVHNAF